MIVACELGLVLLLVVVISASVVIVVGGVTIAASTARSDPKLSRTESSFAAHISLLCSVNGILENGCVAPRSGGRSAGALWAVGGSQ